MTDEALETIRQVFPLALATQDAARRILALLQRELGLEPNQVMHADSICSDDLNAIEYPSKARDMLGPFSLGGLDGFPFAGLTGMRAFAHHVPEDGAVFVFHGPHIGVTKTGEVGKSLRPGQRTPSSCCGAAAAALEKLEKGELVEGAVGELDYQQNTIEQILLRQRDRILEARSPVLETTEVVYEAISERIDLLAARTHFPCKHLVLMGGILINGDFDVGSFVEIRRLTHIDPQRGRQTDWLMKFHV